jgi:hypothetical protein
MNTFNQRRPMSLIAFVVTVFVSLANVHGQATTYYVNGSCGNDSWSGSSPVCSAPNGPKATIFGAYSVTSSTVQDTIEIADGVYTGSLNKGFAITKPVDIRGASQNPSQVTIDCAGSGQFCYVNINGSEFPSDFVLTGVTIESGHQVFGGGILLVSPGTIQSCVIRDCQATNGGNGGGINIGEFAGGSIIDNCTIDSNSTTTENLQYGGGISCSSLQESFLMNSSITGNNAQYGGGVATVYGGKIFIVGCELQNNQAAYLGGGLCCASGQTKLINCRIRSNRANLPTYGNGGGVAVDGADLQLTNCLLTDNSGTYGGGIYQDSGTVELKNCTIASNWIDDNMLNDGFNTGPGCFIEGIEPSFTAHNTLMWGNLTAANAPEQLALNFEQGGVAELRYSDIKGGQSGIAGSSEPTTYANNIDADPLLDGNFQLTFASPCLNNGSASLLPADEFDLDSDNNVTEPLPVDLTAAARQVNPSGCVDIGAFEQQSSGTPGCLADVHGPNGTPDGLVNVSDLLLVIIRWGTPGGIADFAPSPCGDSTVGVLELLAILNGWGDCDSLDEAPETVEECQDKCAQGYSITSPEYAECVDACVRALCEAEILPPEDCP